MGWGEAHTVGGNSKRKTVLPSNDKNFPNGNEEMRLGSRIGDLHLTQGRTVMGVWR